MKNLPLSPHPSTQVSGFGPHPSDDLLIKAENVSKKFCRSLKKSLWYGIKDLGSELVGRSKGAGNDLRPDEFWAVKDVSFELKRGECLGLIGRNGAGKTTLLRMLNGLLKPDKGYIEMQGRVGALIALGAGFNPILTGRENIYVNASVLGLKKKEIDDKFDEIVEFAELGEFIDAPVQNYSSGMQVRLGFSIATALKPDILLLDEILAVGDAGFKVKAYARIGKIIQHSAVIFVTHSMTQLYRICDRVGVVEKGSLEITNTINSAIKRYYKLSSNKNVTDPAVLKHNSIKNFTFNFSKNVDNGKNWSLDIWAESVVDANSGLLIVNFTDIKGLLVAELRHQINKEVIVKKHKVNHISIKINSLPLKDGNYYFDFALYTQDRKLALIHVSGAGPVYVSQAKMTEAVCLLAGMVKQDYL